MTPRKILEETRAGLANPKNWCQGPPIRKRGFLYLRTQRCLWGMVNHVARGASTQARTKADHYLYKASRSLYDYWTYIEVNEELGYDAVIEVLTAAIEMAEADEIKHLDFPVVGQKPTPYVLTT